MSSKLTFILLISLSAGLGLCWYPLYYLTGMGIESSQLLFFALAAASLLTVTFMALQVESWRKNTFELLILALTGGISLVLFQYSLLLGNPIAVVSLFCIAIVTALFLDRLVQRENLVTSEFLIILLLLIVAVLTLLLSRPLQVDWSLLLAALSGVGFHRLYVLNTHMRSDIPVMSKLAAYFIVSTWLVGMVLIFSPRSASFPQENAALLSAFYGAVILVPIVGSVAFLLAKYNFRTLLLWVTLLLSFNLISGIAYLGPTALSTLMSLSILIILAYFIQIRLFKIQSSKEI